jgi:HD-GYP domain-containing protein (c-di-GMP phosphodiesterase class II)
MNTPTGDSHTPEQVEDMCAEPIEAAQRLVHLSEIGLALSSERDIDRLLSLILTRARELTEADAGSLYIVETIEHADARRENLNEPQRTLYFRLSQNDSIHLETNASFPVPPSSLAGYVAFHGEPLRCEDAYCIGPDEPFQFNPKWDRDNGYRTRSVLVVPMKNREGHVIGVLQLINRKSSPAPLRTPEDFERRVVPFDEELAELAGVLASYAAVAIENNSLLSEVTRLLSDIEATFDSFVRGCAQLIDDRDPPTAGHSQRVTRMTVALAQAATRETEGPFAHVHYTPREIQEIQYAGLLHDVGKIGVPEAIFSKSHKLDPALFENVLHRVARRKQELQFQALRLQVLEAASHAREREQQDIAAELEQLEHDREQLVSANNPSVGWLSDEEFALQQEALERLAAQNYCGEDGSQKPLLSPSEREALGVRRGSLTARERAQMEEHAQMSFEFLEQIAWPAHFSRIPDYAHCHHEKLNGRGYPRGIGADDIPLAARMMTVADIYDALTAADRPYKRAMPQERALSILRQEVEAGNLDADLVELFTRERVYEAAQD